MRGEGGGGSSLEQVQNGPKSGPGSKVTPRRKVSALCWGGGLTGPLCWVVLSRETAEERGVLQGRPPEDGPCRHPAPWGKPCAPVRPR